MRVVQFLPELNEGGVERGVVELNRELVQRGIESIVVSAGGKQARRIEQDGGRHIQFDVVSKNPLSVPLRVRRMKRLLQELQPDILHVRSRVPAWLVYLANRSLGIPLITTVHGFNSVNAYSRVMTFGDRVICVSNAIKEYIQEHYQVPDARIVVIPRGVDFEVFHPGRLDQDFLEEFRAKYKLAGRFVVSVVGRITQLKDLETFIRAIALVRNERPNILGLVVGGVREDKQGYFRELQRLVAELGIEAHVQFVGSQEKVAEIYRLSDVVVSSSKKPESFGRSAAEALAMETPVVATAHGGVLDIVRPGETGYLFPVGDETALASMIREATGGDFSGLRTFIEKNFSFEQMAEKTCDVYRKLTL